MMFLKQYKKKEIKIMKYTNHGSGVVVFEDAIQIDQDLIKDYIIWLRGNDEAIFEYAEEDGVEYASNKSGFKFPLKELSLAPDRFTDTLGMQSDRIPDERYKVFIQACDDALYKCLTYYCALYKEAASTIWWRGSGHIAGYLNGKGIGPHCDNAVQFEFNGAPTITAPFHNVTSAALYLNDCVEHEDQLDGTNFIGGHIKFKNAGLDYLPKAGSVVLYPSNYVGAHEVTAVTNGERYAFLEFFAYGFPTNPDGGVNNGNGLNWVKDLQHDSNKISETLKSDKPY